MRRPACCICFCCSALYLVACGPRLIRPAAGDVAEDRTQGLDWSSYGMLLRRIVVGDKIDTGKLLESRLLLDRTLAMVSMRGPRSTPVPLADRDSRLAYVLNCHNAAVLESFVALANGERMPERLPWAMDRRFEFVIDGRPLTVADLREQARRLAAGDWRVRLALYSGRRDGPPLFLRPFLGNLLDAQLDAVTRAALKSDQVVRLDFGARKRLLLWRGLFSIRRFLIEDYERRMHTSDATMLSVLLEWSEPFRRVTLNSAVGYPVEAMPVDRRVNSVQVEQPADGTIDGGS